MKFLVSLFEKVEGKKTNAGAIIQVLAFAAETFGWLSPEELTSISQIAVLIMTLGLGDKVRRLMGIGTK